MTTSEGDLEHPIENREAPHGVLRQVQTSRRRTEEVEPGWTCPGQWRGQETENGWDGPDDNGLKGLTTPEKERKTEDKSDSHRTLAFTSWIECGPMWADRGQNWPDSCRIQIFPPPKGPQGFSGLSPSQMTVHAATQTDH